MCIHQILPWILYSGQEKSVEVLDIEVPQDVESAESMQSRLDASLEVDVLNVSPKMKLFSGATAPGLRIRSGPSFTVSIFAALLFRISYYINAL